MELFATLRGEAIDEKVGGGGPQDCHPLGKTCKQIKGSNGPLGHTPRGTPSVPLLVSSWSHDRPEARELFDGSTGALRDRIQLGVQSRAHLVAYSFPSYSEVILDTGAGDCRFPVPTYSGHLDFRDHRERPEPVPVVSKESATPLENRLAVEAEGEGLQQGYFISPKPTTIIFSPAGRGTGLRMTPGWCRILIEYPSDIRVQRMCKIFVNLPQSETRVREGSLAEDLLSMSPV